MTYNALSVSRIFVLAIAAFLFATTTSVHAIDCATVDLWVRGTTYQVDEQVKKDEKVYKCTQTHDSANNNRPNFKGGYWVQVCDCNDDCGGTNPPTPTPVAPTSTSATGTAATPSTSTATYAMPIFGLWREYCFMVWLCTNYVLLLKSLTPNFEL